LTAWNDDAGDVIPDNMEMLVACREGDTQTIDVGGKHTVVTDASKHSLESFAKCLTTALWEEVTS
jgi:hypothetical protein